jgi:hypothetical protein
LRLRAGVSQVGGTTPSASLEKTRFYIENSGDG